MPKQDISERELKEIFSEMLTEYEIFLSNSTQLLKEAKAIMRKRSKKNGKKD